MTILLKYKQECSILKYKPIFLSDKCNLEKFPKALMFFNLKN